MAINQEVDKNPNELVEEPKSKAKPSAKAKKSSNKKKAELDLSNVTPETVAKLREEYAKLRWEVTTGAEQNTALVRKKKKDIARALTVLNQTK